MKERKKASFVIRQAPENSRIIRFNRKGMNWEQQVFAIRWHPCNLKEECMIVGNYKEDCAMQRSCKKTASLML